MICWRALLCHFRHIDRRFQSDKKLSDPLFTNRVLRLHQDRACCVLMRSTTRFPFPTSTGFATWASVAAFVQRVSLAVALVLFSALGAHAHGTFHEMMDELQSELAARPSDPTLMIRRAFLKIEHADWQAALVDLEKASRLGADEGDLVFLRARALAAGKQWAAAKTALDEFFATHPPIAQAHVERARVLLQLGEGKGALNDYRAALKLTPKPEPELVIEVTEALAAQSLTDEALQVIGKGVEVVGNVPQLVIKAMDLETAAQRYDAALARVDAMMKLMPRPEPWMARRASVLAQAGRLEASRAEWTKLREHLLALPNLERGSHAMTTLLGQANDALTALAQISSTNSTANTIAPSKP